MNEPSRKFTTVILVLALLLAVLAGVTQILPLNSRAWVYESSKLAIAAYLLSALFLLGVTPLMPLRSIRSKPWFPRLVLWVTAATLVLVGGTSGLLLVKLREPSFHARAEEILGAVRRFDAETGNKPKTLMELVPRWLPELRPSDERYMWISLKSPHGNIDGVLWYWVGWRSAQWHPSRSTPTSAYW